MSTAARDDLQTFHEFVRRQLENGGADLTPEQVLAMWRERLETIDSVGRGLQDIDDGRTRSADEVLDELRDELLKP
ncbi:MAG: hypothetical protein DWQ34_16615 [Planctomycetota bacterium]|nr:MAG: hypothetical protein DWQ34_16615 [Planctomycetota bacterium]REJ97288.1 MAG: hypothetical protein DWQ29_00135 [Planctomycetota bacterium]REK24312.1 MAG: hypothetical protein DWQ41_14900 [Planctomycetota bacterium]